MAMPETILRDWERLDEQNRRQAQVFIRFLLFQQRNREESLPFTPQSEARLLERIDRSLSHIAEGKYQDAEEVEAELMSKYGLDG